MDEFKQWVKELRKEFPLLAPVRVYQRDLSGKSHFGDCTLAFDEDDRPLRFTIVVHKSSRALMQYLLIHEWAHAYAWQEGQKVKNHGPHWGVAMSQIYQHMIEE